ncbi:MAG: hypothetical protein SPL54_05985 [Lachnospiraceae bacterium]|jgi:hypothetical protein|nr:hypothetical protein [Lachnospiraceae bacterium]MCH4029377.1 hypothetical protein [Lachnospiraceae bacterium]MCH4067772.1 hypothetical protein [Lachnospiraceae bacterium]MCH4113796.1 hypothetical protein [Lachnospiraceae bacterium]MCI1352699.1 hypothetical protein [Lachnospiraceae bacterium]
MVKRSKFAGAMAIALAAAAVLTGCGSSLPDTGRSVGETYTFDTPTSDALSYWIQQDWTFSGLYNAKTSELTTASDLSEENIPLFSVGSDGTYAMTVSGENYSGTWWFADEFKDDQGVIEQRYGLVSDGQAQGTAWAFADADSAAEYLDIYISEGDENWTIEFTGTETGTSDGGTITASKEGAEPQILHSWEFIGMGEDSTNQFTYETGSDENSFTFVPTKDGKYTMNILGQEYSGTWKVPDEDERSTYSDVWQIFLLYDSDGNYEGSCQFLPFMVSSDGVADRMMLYVPISDDDGYTCYFKNADSDESAE